MEWFGAIGHLSPPPPRHTQRSQMCAINNPAEAPVTCKQVLNYVQSEAVCGGEEYDQS
jgi:hypothetical protein